MLREARGRSEVRQWARTELSMRKEALSPLDPSDLCVLIEGINPRCLGRVLLFQPPSLYHTSA